MQCGALWGCLRVQCVVLRGCLRGTVWGSLGAQCGAFWGCLRAQCGVLWGCLRAQCGILRGCLWVQSRALWGGCLRGASWGSLGLPLWGSLRTQRGAPQGCPGHWDPSVRDLPGPPTGPALLGSAENTGEPLTNPFPGSLPVPIVPTFLYTTEYQGANTSGSPAPPEPTPAAPRAPPFSSVFSYFDNTAVPVRGLTRAVETLNGTGSSARGHPPSSPPGHPPSSPPGHPPGAPPAPARSCLEGGEFLARENTRVGLLFASKALVQLLVNPWVGLLTNR